MIRPALCLAVLLLAPAARADDYPARKAGLWEITVNNGRTSPRAMRMCIDPSTDADMRNTGQNAGNGACGRPTIQRSGEVLTTDMVCHLGKTEMTTHTVTKITGDAAYHSDITVHMNPPVAGRGEQTMTQDAKWTGPCGADMQPGDIITPQGRMNIHDVPHRPAP